MIFIIRAAKDCRSSNRLGYITAGDKWYSKKENFNVNERNNGWDGSFNGKPLNPDVFVYVVDAICDTGEPLTWKGDISLIR